MISIRTISGALYQTIHVTEDNINYNDLLKYIKIPPHPRFKEYNNIAIGVSVKQFIKLCYNGIKVNLEDDINYEKDLTLCFYCEYYKCSERGINKLCDDSTLPDTSTFDKCRILIEQDPFNIIFVNNEILMSEMMTEEIYKNVVRCSGYLLEYIPHEKHTEEICKLAVRRDGLSLEFVKYQTEEICKLAVQQNAHALEYVKEQTEEICKLAIRQNGYALKYVKDQTEEICRLAVQETGISLRYVKKQTLEICKFAIQQNRLALCLIINLNTFQLFYQIFLGK